MQECTKKTKQGKIESNVCVGSLVTILVCTYYWIYQGKLNRSNYSCVCGMQGNDSEVMALTACKSTNLQNSFFSGESRQRGLIQGTQSARLKVTRGVNSPEELHNGFLSTDEGGL